VAAASDTLWHEYQAPPGGTAERPEDLVPGLRKAPARDAGRLVSAVSEGGEVTRQYTKSVAWEVNHDRWEARRRERRALWHDYLPDRRPEHDECATCGKAWEAAAHTPIGY
jgi:hypothetical protein